MVKHASGPSRLVLEKALERVLKRGEFDEQIKRLKITPANAVKELLNDPEVHIAGQQTYEHVEYLLGEFDDKLKSRPRAWPKPSARPLRELLPVTVVALPAALWFAIVLLFGQSLSSTVIVMLTIVALVTTAACGWWLLPLETLVWIRWLMGVLPLMAIIPAEKWVGERELRNDALSDRVRQWLSEKETPSLELEIRLRDADGLTLPAGQGPLVHTAAVEACEREVNRSMPGAVGLAGPRGAGKTTIIERAVAGEFTRKGPMLGVLASAPVRYDARDFVLHLHAHVCRAVLDFLSVSERTTGSETKRLWTRLRGRWVVRRTLSTWTRALVGSSVSAAAALGYAEFVWGWTGDPAVLWRGAVSTAAQAWSDLPGFVLDWHVRIVPAVLAALYALEAVLDLVFSVVLRLLVGLPVAAYRLSERLSSQEPRDPAHAALRAVAEQHMHRIRFLQTRTSGWSGKVSAPLGSDLGLNRSLARAEQPWTHPEVVDRFRDFMELVVEVLGKGPERLSGIIIAIDELDKISDPEEAQRFLNEIKGVFGVPHCLFLVSMSDDALTAFERRGIPARDAFDSSFTTMIHVQPFTLVESRDWLKRRALGIPEPFVWLCHAMSGGLPRDLGRVAIALHDLQADCPHLADVTRELVRQDLGLKVRAFAHAARVTRRAETGESAELQKLVKELQTAVTDPSRLTEIADRIWPDDKAPLSYAEELRAEAACYLIFCQTVDEFFRHLDPEQEDMVDMVGDLARARLHMALDTQLARDLLQSLRSAAQ
ncbi:hypothetical protein SAMN05216188_12374 [Lentzea xinjiangensis]|uniref:KAP family P-loop domain-containing protein n=1 Tax=Lentzea xinjiangensis TaxID=402600 RepID=A0A1H9V190_9PSEU|nr:hypothetical protein [Lentzea xinjiangensis]SES15047.1 hypothetical protein SAMN05216188_12374 [Lentzea xinjiangensis]